ncbi:MAG: hypothetical protein Q9163_002635 [Psora crenata]
MAAAAKTLSALLKQSSINDHEEILRASDAALKTSKNDPELLHIRLIALLKLDRYDDALRMLEEDQGNLKKQANVERAYALYKTGKFEEAKSLAKSIGESRGARHVEAQASYRSEDFLDAAMLYKELSLSQAVLGNEQSDLRINSGATDAQLEWKRQGESVVNRTLAREHLEAFETAYNAACMSIARGELGKGQILLTRAKDLCMSLDELSDQDKLAEVLPIRVQQLYVLSKLGKASEAEKLASEIDIQHIPDPSTRQIAQNNIIVSLTQGKNPYLSHRLLHGADPIPKTDSLFSQQSERLYQNTLVLDLLTQKPKSVLNATRPVLSTQQPTTSAHVNNLSVLNAAAHAQGDLAKFGLKQILPLIDKRPTDIGLVMTVVQLYILTNNHGSAIAVLDSLLTHLSKSTAPSDQDVLYAPGLVALQVSLYSKQNRKTQINSVLAKAASYWRHKSKPPISLLQAAGTCLLDSSSSEDQALARDIFNTLHTSADPSSKLTTAGFIASHALTHPSSITKEVLDSLPPLQQHIAGVDIDALETAGIPSVPSLSSPANSRKRPLDQKPKPVKKRHRHSRLPKDHDPNKKPDPERWLPLRERTNYRPKGKKGKKRDAEREKTQGGFGEKAVEKGGEVLKGSEKPGGGGGGGGVGGLQARKKKKGVKK